MGTGKTRASIEWANLGRVPTLVIVPKGLVPNWHRELKKWAPKMYKDGLFEVISKENFKKSHKDLPIYSQVIVDEAHYFAGTTSQISKSLLWYTGMHMVPRVVLLTATPFMRNAFNVMRLGQVLGKPWNFPLFDRLFFAWVKMGHRWIPVPRKDKASKQLLASYVAKIGETKRLDECADVPVSQEYVESFEITKEQQKAIDSIKAIEPIVRYTREHQISGGNNFVDDYTPTEEVESNKFNRLAELVESTDKIIIVCRYTAEVERIAKHFKGEYINGSVSGTDRDEAIQRCAASDKFVLVVNAACSEGWELPQCETMVFYSHDFSLKNYIQMKGRIQRLNDLRPRVYIHLTVSDTVDEAVHKSLMNKEDFHIAIYAKNNHN
jgi:superfamily II DNA or RNA helicase